MRNEEFLLPQIFGARNRFMMQLFLWKLTKSQTHEKLISFGKWISSEFKVSFFPRETFIDFLPAGANATCKFAKQLIEDSLKFWESQDGEEFVKE